MKPKRKTPAGNVSELFAAPHADNEESLAIRLLSDYEEQAMEWIKNEGTYQGISTGYDEIDKRLGSFLPGEILTIGGDTGHGKSLLAMNIAQNVYEKYQEGVLFINLELTVEQAVQRFYSLGGTDHDYAGIMTQTSNDVNYRDVDNLMLKAKEEGCILVVVDHLHFFDDSIGDNAAAAITRIMKHFKKCAVKHELPVIILSHVTPQSVNSSKGIKNLKPDLHSFKNSKSIEQVSDMVGFVNRMPDQTSHIEFYMRKNRSRPLDPEAVPMIQKGWRLKEL